jgi:DNA-binding IclR family transcriptional regulator
MVACAVPIKSNRGKLLACLFTHAPVIRKDLNQLLEYIPALREAAVELSQFIDQP